MKIGQQQSSSTGQEETKYTTNTPNGMETSSTHAEDLEVQAVRNYDQEILVSPTTSMSDGKDVASRDAICNQIPPIPRSLSSLPSFLYASERLKPLILQEFESALSQAASCYLGDDDFERMVLAVEEMQQIFHIIDPDMDSYGPRFTAAVTIFSTGIGSRALRDVWLHDAVENTKIFVEEMMACEEPNSDWASWDDRLIESTVREYCESVFDEDFTCAPHLRMPEREEVESGMEVPQGVDAEIGYKKKLKSITLFHFKYALSEVACDYLGDDVEFKKLSRRQIKFHAIKDCECEILEARFRAAVVVFSTCAGFKDLRDTHFQETLDLTKRVVQLCCEDFDAETYDEKFVEETIRGYGESIFGRSILDSGGQKQPVGDIKHNESVGESDNAHENVDGASDKLQRAVMESSVEVEWVSSEKEKREIKTPLDEMVAEEYDADLESVGDASEIEDDERSEDEPQLANEHFQGDPQHQTTKMGEVVVDEEGLGSVEEPIPLDKIHRHDKTTTTTERNLPTIAEVVKATWANFWDMLLRPTGR